MWLSCNIDWLDMNIPFFDALASLGWLKQFMTRPSTPGVVYVSYYYRKKLWNKYGFQSF